MVRLYKCPPGLAGKQPADYVTKPLVRWSRHRELLEVVGQTTPFKPWLFRAKEIFLNASVCLGILCALLILAPGIAQHQFHWIKNEHLYTEYFLFICKTIFFIFAFHYAWSMIHAESLGHLVFLWKKDKFFDPKIRFSNGLPFLNRKDRFSIKQRACQEIYQYNLGFKGLYTILFSPGAFLTKDEVWRLRWGWPLFFGFWQAFYLGRTMIAHKVYSNITYYDAVSFLWILTQFLFAFLVARLTLLPLRIGQPFYSSWWLVSQFDIKCLWLPLLRSALYILPVFLAFQAIEWFIFFGEPLYFLLTQQETNLWKNIREDYILGIYCFLLILFRRRIEIFLMAGAPGLPREALRRGNIAFREWIQNHAELPSAPDAEGAS